MLFLQFILMGGLVSPQLDTIFYLALKGLGYEYKKTTNKSWFRFLFVILSEALELSLIHI